MRITLLIIRVNEVCSFEVSRVIRGQKKKEKSLELNIIFPNGW